MVAGAMTVANRAPIQNTDEWLDWRLGGYGASDAPTLVAGDERAWIDLHARKLRLLPDIEATESMKWGLILEDAIAQAYTDAHPDHPKVVSVRRPLMHPERPHVRASLDRKRHRGRVVVELKKWGFPTDDFGPSGTDQVPEGWIDQVQQQLAVTGYDQVDIAVLFAGGSGRDPFRWYSLGRDQNRIDAILALEDAAWPFVARGEMPPWPGPAPTRLRLRDGELEADAELDRLLADGHLARQNKKQAEARVEEIDAQIKERLADWLVVRGTSIDATYKPNRDGVEIGWEQIAKAYRKAIEQVGDTGELAEIWRATLDLDAIESMFTRPKPGARPLRYVPHSKEDSVATH